MRPQGCCQYGFVAMLVLGLPPALCSNWAQINGKDRQNMVKGVEAPFSRRWGFSVAAIERFHPVGYIVPEWEKSKLYVMGGDDYKHETTADLNDDSQKNFYMYDAFFALNASGQYRNDVWRSSGMKFHVAEDYRMPNDRGAPMPRFVSDTTWERMGAALLLPPAHLGYKEWLCCLTASKYPCTNASICADPLYAVTAVNRRWSPRRNHQSVTVVADAGDTILLMGGRARALDPLPLEYRSGGLVENHDVTAAALVSEASPGVIKWLNNTNGWRAAATPDTLWNHERTVLMSDIWATQDGEAWELRNVGCSVNQKEHSMFPGTKEQKCNTNADCVAKRLGNAQCYQGFCVCKHWSPRERFAVAVNSRQVIVAGGVVYVQKAFCGKYACGNEYAQLVNDVWSSVDTGKTWTQLTPTAGWAPRADFAVVYIPIWSQFWLFGGRGGHNDDPDLNPIFGDSWVSDDGVSWRLNASVNEWTPRFGHYAGMESNKLYLAGGFRSIPIPPKPAMPTAADMADLAAARSISNVYRKRLRPIPDELPGQRILGNQVIAIEDLWSFAFVEPTVYNTSTRSVASGFYRIGGRVDLVLRPTNNDSATRPTGMWYQDYSHFSEAFPYVSPDLSLDTIKVPTALRNALATVGVTTIAGLGTLTQTAYKVYAKSFKTDEAAAEVCKYFMIAKRLKERCQLAKETYDGEYMKYIKFIDASTPASAPPVEDIACVGTPEPEYPFIDVVCRQRWPKRAYFGGIAMDGVLYFLGGFESMDNWANDVWYRDDRNPSTLISLAPADHSDEVFFNFVCDEPYCIYEYRVWDVATNRLIRQWTKTSDWVDSFRMNGERRRTRLEVRAYDPAGNRDPSLEYGRNIYEWAYVPKFPLLMVILLAIFFFLLCMAGLEAYRRYRRWLALQKYKAAKKRRKLKYRAKGTLQQYEESLLNQLQKPPSPIELKKDEHELDMPRFRFGSAVEENPLTKAVVVPLEQQSASLQALTQQFMPQPVISNAAQSQVQPQAQVTAQTAIGGTQLNPQAAIQQQVQVLSPSKIKSKKPELQPGVPIVVSLATGKPILESNVADRVPILPGVNALQAVKKVVPDPKIRLADNTMVVASDLRIAPTSLQQPKVMSAFETLRRELARSSAAEPVGGMRSVAGALRNAQASQFGGVETAHAPGMDSRFRMSNFSPGGLSPGRQSLMSPGMSRASALSPPGTLQRPSVRPTLMNLGSPRPGFAPASSAAGVGLNLRTDTANAARAGLPSARPSRFPPQGPR